VETKLAPRNALEEEVNEGLVLVLRSFRRSIPFHL
jgi:hypothetical protein